MEVAPVLLVALSMAVVVLFGECGLSAQAQVVYSLRLIHRFSDEMRALRVSRAGRPAGDWTEGSLEYHRRLMKNDVERQKMKVGSQNQLLFPSAGSNTMSSGNDLGWLHYTWIDIGMPSVSFLVALDTGSDLLWLPCDCVQCAPLSDNDLNEYNPSHSNTSKSISCSHQLCELGPTCKTSKQPCPYTVKYASTDTSSSGSLFQDILHLASDDVNASNAYVRAPVIIGCGREQSGGYLDGIAPDGLLGLGLGDVSVPSFLAKSGVSRNAFSLCFGEAGSGKIYFGDQGLANQRTTPFLPMDGKYTAYIIGVENLCIGTTCLDQTSFKALFDSGTSFTSLPDEVYKGVVEEFDRQANATKYSSEDLPFRHCYKSSSQRLPKVPSVTMKFAVNNSFVIHEPLFVLNDSQGVVGFCLAIQSSPHEMGVIGQNFMKGYRLFFDRENLTLGWSRSKCEGVKDSVETTGSNATSPISLPTTEQQRAPNTNAVAPAIAGRAPSKASGNSILLNSYFKVLLLLLLLFHIMHVNISV